MEELKHELLTIKETADFLKVSKQTIRRRIEKGQLKAINANGSLLRPLWRIKKEDLLKISS